MGKFTTILLAALLSLLVVGGAAEAKPKKPPKLSAGLLNIGMAGATEAVALGGPGDIAGTEGLLALDENEDFGYDLTECRQTKTRNTARGCDGEIVQTYVDQVTGVAYRVHCEFEVKVSTKKIKGGTNPVFTFTNASGYGGAIDSGEKVRKVYTQRSTDLTCGALVPDS